MAEARIRPETQGAEGILHDLGVLSIMASDSMAMGHMGEMIIENMANRIHHESEVRSL